MAIASLEQEILDIFDLSAKNYRYKEGIKKIEKIVEIHPELKNESVLSELGFLYDHLALQQKNKLLRNKYEEKAFNLYRGALKKNRESINAIWGIGRIWWHRKNRKAVKYAIKAANLMKKLHGSAGLMLQNVGLVYEALGDIKRAEQWYLRGLKEEPNNFGGYYNLLNFHHKQERREEVQRLLPAFKKLYQKETTKFKKTSWGKDILKKIKELEQFVLLHTKK